MKKITCTIIGLLAFISVAETRANVCKVDCSLDEIVLKSNPKKYVTKTLEIKTDMVIRDDENIYFSPVTVNGIVYRLSLWTDDERGGFVVEKRIDGKFRKHLISSLDQRKLLDLNVLDTSKCKRNENALFIEQSLSFFPDNPTFYELELECKISK